MSAVHVTSSPTGQVAGSTIGDMHRSAAFERFAAPCAILVGVTTFLYSVAFIIISRSDAALGTTLSSLFQLIGATLTTAVLVALYERLRATDGAFALWGVLLGLAAAAGSMIHGGYDLANALNPPSSNVLADANLPSQIDPRGLLTFGIAGLSVLVFSWLMTRSNQFPKALGYLGYVLGALLLILYLGRLIILQDRDPLIAVPALIAGFVANPAWYIWLGLALWRRAGDRMS